MRIVAKAGGFVGEYMEQMDISYNEIQVSEKFERDLIEEGRGGVIKVAFNRVPLFITSNIKSINKYVMNWGGGLEIVVNEEELASVPKGVKGHVKVYSNPEGIVQEFSTWRNNRILYRDVLNTFLYNGCLNEEPDSLFRERYGKLFEELKKGTEEIPYWKITDAI